MFEGHERCALCNSGLAKGEGRKRTDIDGVSHAFCANCVGKTEEMEKRLKLRF